MNRTVVFLLAFVVFAALLHAEDRVPGAGVDRIPPIALPARLKDYQILPNTISPNAQYGLLYPKFSLLFQKSDYGLYLVALKPFRVVTAIPLGYSNLADNARCSYAVRWAKDSTGVVVNEGIKWGPDRVYVVQIHEGKAGALTELVSMVRKQVQPDFAKSGAEHYNDTFDYIFENDSSSRWEINSHGQVEIECKCTTDPKENDPRSWSVRFKGTWDISKGDFVVKGFKRLKFRRFGT